MGRENAGFTLNAESTGWRQGSRSLCTGYHGGKANRRANTSAARKMGVCCCHSLRPNENIFNLGAPRCVDRLARPIGDPRVLGGNIVPTCRAWLQLTKFGKKNGGKKLIVSRCVLSSWKRDCWSTVT